MTIIRLTRDFNDLKAGDYERLDPRLMGLVGYLLRTGVAEKVEGEAKKTPKKAKAKKKGKA